MYNLLTSGKLPDSVIRDNLASTLLAVLNGPKIEDTSQLLELAVSTLVVLSKDKVHRSIFNEKEDMIKSLLRASLDIDDARKLRR